MLQLANIVNPFHLTKKLINPVVYQIHESHINKNIAMPREAPVRYIIKSLPKGQEPHL